MHINEDNFIPEIIDPGYRGEVLPEGSVGELVFTCITKDAFSAAAVPYPRYLCT